jgi:hypothetical protein
MFMTNSMFDSMPCTFDDHDRLEFLETDKEAMLCFNFVNCMTKRLEFLENDTAIFISFEHLIRYVEEG